MPGFPERSHRHANWERRAPNETAHLANSDACGSIRNDRSPGWRLAVRVPPASSLWSAAKKMQRPSAYERKPLAQFYQSFQLVSLSSRQLAIVIAIHQFLE